MLMVFAVSAVYLNTFLKKNIIYKNTQNKEYRWIVFVV